MNKKLKKLIKTPRLYFVDMFKKKLAKGTVSLKYLPMLKVKGNHKFSVVSAVYGVEKYLEQYFASIENQTLSFVDHIELIMVDDGSLDGSAEIIKKWVEKYPKNIKYVKKENGGQASARNLGMEHVTNDWVTFIDPDDFVDVQYFAEVDKFISQEDKIALVSCNFIFYLEDKDRFSDSHPLSYRFKYEHSIFYADNLKDHIQLSVNSVFFKVEIIRSNDLIMGTSIKPNFEDAHFVGKYLLLLNDTQRVVFLKSAIYYYRKRADNSSTLDRAWSNPLQFSDKLRYGDLDLLLFAQKQKGLIPAHIQRSVLYDLIWYFKYLINNNQRLSFLSTKEKDNFLLLLEEIFNHLDVNIIDKFGLAGCWFFHKVGMVGSIKGQKFPFQIVYIDEYDQTKKLIKLRYFYCGEMPLELFKLDDDEITPLFIKSRSYEFAGKDFVNERIIWLAIGTESKQFDVSLDGEDVRLSLNGKHHYSGLPTKIIYQVYDNKILNDKDFPYSIRKLRKLANHSEIVKQYAHAWLIMDRDTQADDNAEHLYRYISLTDLSINAFFVLSEKSHDWHRLKEEGFKLLKFGSREHKLALLNADHLISSHADQYVTDFLPRSYFGDLLKYSFTFLQHGITKDDLSGWLNSKPIKLLVTATNQEYSSIAGNENNYKFSEKEVLLTGFPRHDALIELNQRISDEKLIIIMPTWRKGLAGETIGKGNKRKINNLFYDSEFALQWKALLHSDKFKKLINEYEYQILFFPHANIQPYLSWFQVPEYIQTTSHTDVTSMQQLFCRAQVMVTDYSSVAFEMAYLKKSIIYYHFDNDYVFGGGHLATQGYFNYEEDGFGKVCYEEDELINHIASVLVHKVQPDQLYIDRMDKTFKHRDGLSCNRVFEAILRLDSPDVSVHRQSLISEEYAKKAMSEKNWVLASKRWEDIYKNRVSSIESLKDAGISLIQSCYFDGRLGEAESWMDDLYSKIDETGDDENKNCVNIERAKLLVFYYYWERALNNIRQAHFFMLSGEWEKAFDCWKSIKPNLSTQIYIDSLFSRIKCLSHLRKWKEIGVEITRLDECKLSKNESILKEGWFFVSSNTWVQALEIWQNISHTQISTSATDNLILVHLEKGDFTNAAHLINSTGVGLIESDFFPTIKRAISSLKQNLDALVFTSTDFSISEAYELIEALKYYKQLDTANNILGKTLEIYPECNSIAEFIK